MFLSPPRFDTLVGGLCKKNSRTTSLSIPHITCEIYIHTHIYVYICIYVCISKHICVHMHTYVNRISLHHVPLRRAVVAPYRHFRISIHSLSVSMYVSKSTSLSKYLEFRVKRSRSPIDGMDDKSPCCGLLSHFDACCGVWVLTCVHFVCDLIVCTRAALLSRYALHRAIHTHECNIHIYTYTLWFHLMYNTPTIAFFAEYLYTSICIHACICMYIVFYSNIRRRHHRCRVPHTYEEQGGGSSSSLAPVLIPSNSLS